MSWRYKQVDCFNIYVDHLSSELLFTRQNVEVCHTQDICNIMNKLYRIGESASKAYGTKIT